MHNILKRKQTPFVLLIKNSKKAVAVLGFLLFSSFGSHEVYISSLQMELIPQTAELQLILQVFTDDLEQVLQNRSETSLVLDPDSEAIDPLIINYIEEVLQLSSGLKPIELHYLGKEYKNDLTLIYLETTLADEVQTLQMNYQLFLEEIPTQQNIVHYKRKHYRKSFLFDQRSKKIDLPLF